MNVGRDSHDRRLHVPALTEPSSIKGPNYIAARGTFHVSQDGRDVTVMYPEKRRYTRPEPDDDRSRDLSGVSCAICMCRWASHSTMGRWSVRLYHKALCRLDLGWLFDRWPWAASWPSAIAAIGSRGAVKRPMCRRRHRWLARQSHEPISHPVRALRGRGRFSCGRADAQLRVNCRLHWSGSRRLIFASAAP